MTIPENLDFTSLNEDFSNVTTESLLDYTRDIAQEVQYTYQNIAANFNGFNKASFLDDTGTPNRQENWTPNIYGTTSQGSTTYVQQNGWVFRQGLLTDVWFDIEWTATTATGNLYVDIPYLVARIDGMPFVGVIQSSTLNYATGTILTCNAIPNTYRCEIWRSGSTLTTANLAVGSSGRLTGHVRYIGQSNEQIIT